MTRMVTNCGLCGSGRLEPVLWLGSSPPACAMLPVGGYRPQARYPLELLQCQDCTLVQLSVVVDPSEVFPPDYAYSSGNSPQLHRNFESIVQEIRTPPVNTHLRDKLVVDIGANDGTLLSKFSGMRTVGVEPTRQSEKIGGPRYQEPFTEALARRIVAEHGPASVVTACNVLAHVEDIDDVMRGIAHLLTDGGLLVAENGDLGAMLFSGAWDFAYHEHLRYFSPYSFHQLLRRHGFGLKTWKQTPTHGGSFRVFARKGSRDLDVPRRPDHNFTVLQESVARVKAQLQSATVEPVWGIGATARATTVLNCCGLDVEQVQCICEVPRSDKIGRYVPGTRIPVVSETELFEKQPDRALLFSWHLADMIVPKLREHGYDGEIIVPELSPLAVA